MALRVRQPAATPARTLRYGPHREQVADLWLPAGPGPHPTVVSVHGGYFQAAHGRDLHDPMAHRLVGAGIAVLNVEYRRANAGGSFHETTQDVLAAVDLLGSVPDVRLRRGVAAVGHSAGGYLALWAAAHPDVELVVALAAASDLPDCVRGGYDGGGVAHWMGATPDADPDRYERADLRSRLPTATATWLVHGTADPLVPVAQSVRYARAARSAGDETHLVLLDGEGHFTVIEPGAPAFERWFDVVRAWVEAPP